MWGEIEKRNLYVTDRILLSSQRRPAAGTVQRRLLRRGLYGHLGQLSNGDCSGAVYMAIWDWCESELDLDVRFPAPQAEDTLDCALLKGELASNVLAALREQDLPELAAEIAPDWDLPTEAVQSGLETLRSHLELVQDNAGLLYEMT